MHMEIEFNCDLSESTLTSDLFMICLVHDHARNIERDTHFVKNERGEWKALNDDLKCAHARFQYIELENLMHKSQTTIKGKITMDEFDRKHKNI